MAQLCVIGPRAEPRGGVGGVWGDRGLQGWAHLTADPLPGLRAVMINMLIAGCSRTADGPSWGAPRGGPCEEGLLGGPQK